MTIDRRFLYKYILDNLFDPIKYFRLSDPQRCLNGMIVLNNNLFPEVKLFWEQLLYEEVKSENNEGTNSWPLESHQRVQLIFESDQMLLSKAILFLRGISEQINESYSSFILSDRVEYLKTNFNISKIEVEAIFALIILKNIDEKTLKKMSFLEEFYLDHSRRNDRVFTRKHLMQFVGEDQNLATGILNEESPIVISSLIENSFFDRINISESLYNYICSEDSNTSNLHNLETKSGPVFTLDSFSIDSGLKDLCLKLLMPGKPISMLLYGPPGVGKSEFARSIGDFLNREILFVPTSKPGRDNGLDRRKRSLTVASLTSNPVKQIIVVDECDDLMDSRWDFLRSMKGEGVGQKEFVNNLLDNSKAIIIFIANYLTLDESSGRRVSLIIEFNALKIEQRKEMITNTFKANSAEELLSEAELHNLVVSESLSQGIIGLALKNSISSSSDIQTQKEIFLSLIENRQKNSSQGRNRRRIGLT
jgi:hypothetical protein